MLCSGICLGIWLVLTGCSIARFRNPKKAPTKVSGTETQNHNASKATSVKKGMAADEPSYHRTRFMMKNSAKTTLMKKSG